MKKENKPSKPADVTKCYSTKTETHVRSEHKDRLFNFIFGREENKAWTLSLFNAVNGSSYDDPAQIEFNTLEDVLYMGMRNDTSFLIADLMNLYEHQSTFNPNMPLRMLEYVGRLFSSYLFLTDANKYGSSRIHLPVPKLLVFYNGEREVADETVLYLSDLFDATRRDESDVEVRVRMLNINYGRNRALMEACKPLAEYSWFIARIREAGETLKELTSEDWETEARSMLADAAGRALDEMPEDFVIREYMLKHRAEVIGMLDTEFDIKEIERLFKADARRERQRAEEAEARAEELAARVKELESQLLSMRKPDGGESDTP